jgi:hypothetical protein
MDPLFLRGHLDHSALLRPRDQRFLGHLMFHSDRLLPMVRLRHLALLLLMDLQLHLALLHLRGHLAHLDRLLLTVRGRRLHRLFLLRHLSRLGLWLL